MTLTLLALLVETACGPGSVGLVEVGPGPGPAAHEVIAAQLAAELQHLGLQRCDDSLDTRVEWRWWSPTKLTVTVSSARGTQTKTIEREASALPLALAVFTGEMLRDYALPEVAAPPAPEPPPEPVVETPPRASVLLASAESLYSPGGSLLAGGSLTYVHRQDGWTWEVSAGALGAPNTASASGVVTAWGLMARGGAAYTLVGDARSGLDVAGHAGLFALRVVGFSSSEAAGLPSWSPAMVLRAGPQVRLGTGRLALRLAGGIGTWLPRLSILDGATKVGGTGPLEVWLQVSGGFEL